MRVVRSSIKAKKNPTGKGCRHQKGGTRGGRKNNEGEKLSVEKGTGSENESFFDKLTGGKCAKEHGENFRGKKGGGQEVVKKKCGAWTSDGEKRD